MILRNKYVRYGLLFLILVSILVSLSVAYRRHVFEKENNKVEMVLTYREVKRMSILGNVDRKELLHRLKEEVSISSIVVEEDTLQDYLNEGKATLLKGSEVMNLYRIGHTTRRILSYLYKTMKVKPDSYYIVVDEREDYERIERFLNAEFGKENIRGIRRWNILEVRDEEEDLLQIGLGISDTLVKELTDLGFSVILRLHNSNRVSDAVIRQKFSNLYNLERVNTIIFKGENVLGYSTKLSFVEKKLAEGGFNIGLIEFVNQAGAKTIAMMRPESVLKVHSISDSEMASIAVGKAVKRYVRAAKERGARILFIHPFFNQYQGQNIIEFNMKYFNDIFSRLTRYGFKIEALKKIPIDEYIPARVWEIFLLSLGVLSVLLLMINYFVPLNLFRFAVIYTVFVLLFFCFYLMEKVSYWSSLMTISTSIIFPAVAVISQFPQQNKFGDKFHRWISSVSYLMKMLGICLIGAFLIVGFKSNIDNILGINRFYGVKISFITPLIFIGIYFYLRPHRISSFFYVFKRLFYSPIRTSSLISVFVCILLVVIYILRSGNYISFHIPLIESYMREFLEDVLFIRPRTKEFLIGYPFLLFTYLYADIRISRKWLWFFNIMGSVALISIVNTFCHFHTPLEVSIYRTFLGLGLGYCIGLLYIEIFKLGYLLYKKMT